MMPNEIQEAGTRDLNFFSRHELSAGELSSGLSEFRSCAKVEVAVLGSPSLIVLMVSVRLKQY